MRIFICDDEPQMVRQIGQQVREYIPQSVIEEFSSARDLMQDLKEGNCDILLLDIDMPEMNGLEVARKLKEYDKNLLLIFVTSHDELVYDSLQFHPFGFVRKSFLDVELPKVLADCERELRNKRALYHFRTGEGDVYLPLSEILYFESDGNYLLAFTRERYYRFRETLSALQEVLSGQGFVRVHKGFLVNMAMIKLLSAGQLTLENDSVVPMGRNYGEDARKQIMRYMLR